HLRGVPDKTGQHDYITGNGDAMGYGGSAVTSLHTYLVDFSPVVSYAVGVPVGANAFLTAYKYYDKFVPLETYRFNSAAPVPHDDDDDETLDQPLLQVYDRPVVLFQPFPDDVDAVDFGTTTIGASASKTLYLVNAGGETLNIESATLLHGGQGFAI